MSGSTPEAVLYDISGNALAVQNGAVIPVSTPALMIAGSDGTNSRYIAVDGYGRQVMVGAGVAAAPSGGVLSIQGVAGGTTVPISGTVSISGTTVVSGTVTANQGLPNTLQNAWPVELTDGYGNLFGEKNNPFYTFSEITDGIHGTAAVKAASTAAVAADPALVVSVSPNTPITVGVSQQDVTASGTLNALNAAVTIALAGTAGAGMFLAAGTLIGTIVPEISNDGGTNWVAGSFFDPITGVLASSIVFASSNTATTKTNIICGGASHVRVRVSAFTSGTATCNLRATTANDPSTAIRGTDGTVLRTILLDTSGRIIIAPAGSSSSTSGFVVGDILLSSTGNVVVRRTTLTEQSSDAQRSVVSSNANDTSAGTGARTVKITYYDSTGAGPSTETITMNGTSAVNTVSTTICYVERVEVLTVGSTGSNVGAITLKAATAGGGATIMTMNATDNQTYLSLHYVPTGKTCYITGINVGSNSSGIAQGGLYTLRAQSLSANSPDKQISDFLYLFGQSSGLTRDYGTPIKVDGPARIQLWVNPFSNNTVTFGGGFDFYDQ